MYHWNTKQIKSDLVQIPGILNVVVRQPGGNIDTDNLVLEISGANDNLFVCGFITNHNIQINNPSNVKIDLIELQDAIDWRGGFHSKDILTRKVFIKVRKYFINRRANVVASMYPYF